MTILEIFRLLDAVAPFETQADWDNSGLLVGSPSREVTGVLFALDATEAVLREAVSLGANLIVTHHPLMFRPLRRLTDETAEGRILLGLAKADIGLIASHTCLDQAPGGINDALAEACALLDVEGEGYLRVGNLPRPMKAVELKEYLAAALDTEVRLMGDPSREVRRLGLSSGAGSEMWKDAALLGAGAFLSGEVKHHHALEMAAEGIPCFECGHYATELPGIFALADALQSALNQVQYRIHVFKSAAGAYSAPEPGQAG